MTKLSDTENCLENLLRRWFRSSNIDWEYTGDGSFKIGPYNPDWICRDQRKIIELNGCYWHGCSVCNYDNKYRKGKIKRDDKKIKYYKSLGWKVLVIWEHEVNGNIFKLRKDVEEFSME